jgi:hypothetical protein
LPAAQNSFILRVMKAVVRTESSRVLGAMGMLLGAVLLVLLLSGPAAYYDTRRTWLLGEHSALVQNCGQPLWQVVDRTPLGGTMRGYRGWWANKAEERYGFDTSLAGVYSGICF